MHFVLIILILLIMINFWIRERYIVLIITVFQDLITILRSKIKILKFSHFFSIFHKLFLLNSSIIHHCFCKISVESSCAGNVQGLLKQIGEETDQELQLLQAWISMAAWRIHHLKYNWAKASVSLHFYINILHLFHTIAPWEHLNWALHIKKVRFRFSPFSKSWCDSGRA